MKEIKSFRTRERETGKTTYGHFDYVINKASEYSLKKILGLKYEQAKKVIRKRN